jgi:putative oxidoreductase
MKTFNHVLRILLGIVIAFSGINKFTHWLNAQYMHDAMAFVLNLSNIGGAFIINTIGVLEITLGFMLILNRYTTLALLALLPLIVSILIFHISLDLKGMGVALFVFLIDVYLLYHHKDNLSNLFVFKE